MRRRPERSYQKKAANVRVAVAKSFLFALALYSLPLAHSSPDSSGLRSNKCWVALLREISPPGRAATNGAEQ